MSEYSITPIVIDDEHIAQYAYLLQTCFPSSKIFTNEYLKWLYNQNPCGFAVGFDAWKDGSLAAHYVTIPIMCKRDGKESKALLSLNTATHPEHQGKGLFTKLAKSTYQLATENGYSCVVGVANQNSTHGFTNKLDFQLVTPLNAYIGLGIPNFRPEECNKNASSFIRIWSEENMKWRVSNPNNNLIVSNKNNISIIIGKTHKSGFKAITIRDKYEIDIRDDCCIFPNLKVFVGILPNNLKIGWNYFPLPNHLKSSPLNMIYRSLDGNCTNLDKNKIFFDFLDFDIF